MRRMLISLAASVLLVGSAAASSFTVNASDTVYGAFNGTVSSPGSFDWQTAGYFWSGNIDLTYSGKVIADIVTNNDDTYTLYTADAAIGGPCGASACLSVTVGETVSLYNTINSLNGGQGVCCDFNGWTPQVTVNSVSAPEPSTWALAALGFAGLAGLGGLRRKSAALAA